jgi:platelet-activating factor acetylhydrolase IB subunit alpha
MVLTANQKNQLNRDILEYLVKNDYSATGEKFAEEIGVSLADIDPEGNKLEIKWKSILSLQKKINNLEDELKSVKEDLEKAPNRKPNSAANVDDFYLPKTPPKFELKGHKASVTSLAFHPQYTQLASASEDGTVKIWEFETGDFERTLKGHTSTCRPT